LIVTLYRGAKAPDPIGAPERTWPEFCEDIAASVNELTDAPATAKREAQKVALLAFGPYRLRANQARADHNVEAGTLLVADVDRCDGAALCASIEALGIAALVYESPSSPNEDGSDRVRVVAPITRELAPNEIDPVRLVFAELVGLDPETSGVAGALGASRIFFVGRLHDSPERAVWTCEGAPVNVDALLEAAGELAPSPAPAAPRANVDPAGDDEIGAIIGAHGAFRGRRHDLAGAIGGALRRLSVGRGRAEALGRAYFGEEKWGEHGAWLLGAFDKPAAEVSGRVRAVQGRHAGRAVGRRLVHDVG
jgi:hypothetical protein